ncbi:flagellar hook-length control protein FliK [Hydrogenimonas sp.]
MASMGLAPLRAMLEEARAPKGSKNLQSDDTALFRKLFEMLEGADAEAAPDTAAGRDEKGETPVSLRLKRDDTEKSGNRTPPLSRLSENELRRLLSLATLSSEAGRNEAKEAKGPESGLRAMLGRRMATEAQTPPVPQAVEDRTLSLAAPLAETPKALETARARALALLKERGENLRTESEIRGARDLAALYKAARKAGLDPVRFSLQVTAEAGTKPNAERPSPTAAPAKKTPTLRRASRLSALTARILRHTAAEEGTAAKADITETRPARGNSVRQERPLPIELGKPAEWLEKGLRHADTDEKAAPLPRLFRARGDIGASLARLLADAATKKVAHEPATRVPESGDEARQGDTAPRPDSFEPESLTEGAEGAENRLAEAAHRNDERLGRRILEAKETVRHFAQSLREQVENYKPPFSRMQMSLEPRELGSVEVTMIHRGNQLHIQVNANPTAVGLMATQGQELRNQLVSMGFTDVQMQFSMNQQKQQQRQGKQPSGAAKEYLALEEIPDHYESLTLTLPRYI